MSDLLIVDGYNIINSWKDLNAIKEVSIERARDKLVKYLVEYQDVKGMNIIVVFDGCDDSLKNERFVSGVCVMFSTKGQTADSLIEKIIYNKKDGINNIYIATSDKHEQFMALGMGAIRFSAREFEQEIKGSKKKLDSYMKSNTTKNNLRFSLRDHLPADIIKKIFGKK